MKEFAFELGPVISDICNASLREGYIPSLLKSANGRPLPKQTPACSIQDDVRPVSLTCQVAKVLEGLTLAKILPLLLTKLDSKQFAVAGKSTVQAVVYFIARNRGHFAPVINCQRNLIFKMADKVYRSQGNVSPTIF